MSQLCHELHLLFNQLPTQHFPFDSNRIPNNGIYILFEAGETAHSTNRIVRIGTHKGTNQLPARLMQHFVKENKDRSIFRKNIGRAILHRNHDPFLAQWELDLTTKEARQQYSATVDADKQKQIEQQISEYMRSHFHFAALRVDSKEERMRVESRTISTISLYAECGASDSWLGRSSPKEKIRESGLWLVNELYREPFSTSEYADLQKYL